MRSVYRWSLLLLVLWCGFFPWQVAPSSFSGGGSGGGVDLTSAQTLTNKRLTLRAVLLTDAATITPNGDTTDIGYLTSLSQGSTFANPTGTPTEGQQLLIRIRSASAQTLAWGTAYSNEAGIALPTTTIGGNLYDEFGFQWNVASSHWALIGTTRATTSFPDIQRFPAANCVNAVAGVAWSVVGGSPSGVCRAGTNNKGGVLAFADADAAQFEVEIPGDWNTAQQPYINLFFSSASNASGTMIFQAATACSKADGSITDDPAFTAADVLPTKTSAAANRNWASNIQMTQVTSGNNCVAGGTMLVKITRNTDTAAAVVWVEKAVLTFPRSPVVQAN